MARLFLARNCGARQKGLGKQVLAGRKGLIDSEKCFGWTAYWCVHKILMSMGVGTALRAFAPSSGLRSLTAFKPILRARPEIPDLHSAGGQTATRSVRQLIYLNDHYLPCPSQRGSSQEYSSFPTLHSSVYPARPSRWISPPHC